MKLAGSNDVLVDLDQIARYSGPPLYLFVGISTAGSSVHAAFPAWARILAPGAVLRGVDIPEHADPSDFLQLVQAMRDNPLVQGAVITSHKLRLYQACADILDLADPLVAITHEINSLDTRDGRVKGFARDAQSLDLIIDTLGGDEVNRQRPFVCIGAGGSAIALMLAIGLDITSSLTSGSPMRRIGDSKRGPLTILGRRQASLDDIHSVRVRAGIPEEDVSLVLAPTPEDVSRVTKSLMPGTVVANATGLGKLGHGSPIVGAKAFSRGALAWDFNYRGPLDFLKQAQEAGLRVEDGWDYFVAGWMAALAAIVDVHPDASLLAVMNEASLSSRV